MTDPDPRTLLELYALGELDDRQTRAVEAWLAEHPDAQAELDAARRTLAALDAELAPPPDADGAVERLVERVAQPRPRPRRWAWLRYAAAVVVIAALTVLIMGPRWTKPRYPGPTVEGAITVADGGELRRGAVLATGNEGGSLELGGYCRLDVGPNSVLRLTGEPRDERIVLEHGRVLCDVDRQIGQFAVETELCTAVVQGTRFIVQLDDPTGGADMLRKKVLVRVLAGAVLVSGAWGQDVVTAGEAKVLPGGPAVAVPAPAPAEDPAEALKGFKGFLVGELLKAGDEGLVMLVRAATLVEGSTAKNPGILLGKETAIEFATEKDAKGKTGPIPWLVKAAKKVGKMPAMAFGGLGGDAVVIMDVGRDGENAGGNVVRATARAMTMHINGNRIQLGGGGDEEDAEPKPEPKGPVLTVRVKAAADGKLVVDRLMPGSAPGHTWAAMPQLRFTEGAQAGGVGPINIIRGDNIAIEAVEGIARAAAGNAELQRLRAQQKVAQAQVEAFTQHVAMLKKQLGRADGQAPPEHVARLRAQMAEAEARLEAAKAQLDRLQAQAAQQEQLAQERRQVILRRVEVAGREGMAANDELMRRRVQQEVAKAQMRDLTQQLKILKLQLANGGELPPEAAARLERQAAHLWAQIAKQKERLAQLEAQEVDAVKPALPKRGPNDTDF